MTIWTTFVKLIASTAPMIAQIASKKNAKNSPLKSTLKLNTGYLAPPFGEPMLLLS